MSGTVKLRKLNFSFSGCQEEKAIPDQEEMRKKEFLGHLKKIFSPKILFTFIQDGSNFKALTNEQSGLCFAYVQI